MIRTRFAPSPTGYMHIGNLRTALYEYFIAKHDGGRFILRIEDTDKERYVEGAVDVIYKTLEMAGIKHDEGPDVGGEYGPYIQSERKNNYMKYALELIEKGEAYYCFCTKERLDSLRSEGDIGVKYDRHCLNLTNEEIEENLKNGAPFVIRQKIRPGKTSFYDEVYGEVTVNNEDMEDQILIKSDGLPTYNFANVIDDHLMNITHVVRGNEYLSSTPKYNLLYEAFGWDIPKYIHVAPVMKDAHNKLSKRNGDASFQDLVAKGYLPEAIVNYITLLGWAPSENREIFSIDELIKAFDIKGISKSPAIFDPEKLRWMNGEYVKMQDFEEFYKMAEPVLKGCIKTEGIDYRMVANMVKSRVCTVFEIPELVDFIDKLPEYDKSLYAHKKMKTNEENSAGFLKIIIPVIEKAEKWDNDSLYQIMAATAKENGLKNGQILWPVRTALSGKAATPCGASELCVLLGKEETLKRLYKGLEVLEK